VASEDLVDLDTRRNLGIESHASFAHLRERLKLAALAVVFPRREEPIEDRSHPL
jgi:hypothetical protein